MMKFPLGSGKTSSKPTRRFLITFQSVRHGCKQSQQLYPSCPTKQSRRVPPQTLASQISPSPLEESLKTQGSKTPGRISPRKKCRPQCRPIDLELVPSKWVYRPISRACTIMNWSKSRPRSGRNNHRIGPSLAALFFEARLDAAAWGPLRVPPAGSARPSPLGFGCGSP